MNLLGLPNEILIKIISNLHKEGSFCTLVAEMDLLNVSLVSKKMRELALDPVLWTKLILDDSGRGRAFNLETCQGRDSPILYWF
jgi:hypothetical protein